MKSKLKKKYNRFANCRGRLYHFRVTTIMMMMVAARSAAPFTRLLANVRYYCVITTLLHVEPKEGRKVPPPTFTKTFSPCNISENTDQHWGISAKLIMFWERTSKIRVFYLHQAHFSDILRMKRSRVSYIFNVEGLRFQSCITWNVTLSSYREIKQNTNRSVYKRLDF